MSTATSTAKIEANRANAQKSTGPVTPEGKAASSRNATSHGLDSKEIYVRPGELAEYVQFEENLIAEYQPANEAESVFFKVLLHSAWKLRRCRQLETALENEAESLGAPSPLLHDELGRKADRVARHARAAERSHAAALRELRKLQSERDYRNKATTGVPNHSSPAIDSKANDSAIARCNRHRTATVAENIRTRFAPGSPVLFDNEDGTFTAQHPNGVKSNIRFTGSMIVDEKPNKATANTAPATKAAA